MDDDLTRWEDEGGAVPPPDLPAIVTFTYRNYCGDIGTRKVRPIRLWYGATRWHPGPQWLLRAFCIDRQEERDFAMSGIIGGWAAAKEEQSR